MKADRFFYRFGQWRNAWSATNQHIEREDDLVELNSSFSEAKVQWEEFLNSLWEAEATLNRDFSERKNRKIQRLNDWIFWDTTDKIREIFELKTIYIDIVFSRPISESMMKTLEEFSGFSVIKLSSFDTVATLHVQNWEISTIPWLWAFSREQINFLWESISRLSSGAIPKTFTVPIIKSLHSDKTQKQLFENFAKENIIGKHDQIMVAFSPDLLTTGDFTILNELYSHYVLEGSKILGTKNIRERAGKWELIILTFTWFPKEFFIDMVLLIDWIMEIERLEKLAPHNTSENLSKEIITISRSKSPILDNLPIISILDSKVVTDPVFLTTDLVSHSVKLFNATADDFRECHGTQVASLAIYWDVINNSALLPRAKVFGLTGSFLGSIEDIVLWANSGNSKIINCSQWLQKPKDVLIDNEHSISPLAIEIDQALVNKDILWILSAGNINHPLTPTSYTEFSEERTNINAPKDSISTISVWSHDLSISKVSLFSRKDNTQPNIMIGWQAGFMLRLKDKVKPEFLACGDDTITFNGASWLRDSWTSFSAPKMAHNAARILSEHPNATADTIKCFLLNYAKLKDSNRRFYWFWKTAYADDDIARRHFGFWTFDFWDFEKKNMYLDIVIQDFIKTNQRKEYPIKLPKIWENESIKIVRSIAYNPPVSGRFHLKYCRFCVSWRLWSNTFEDLYNSTYDSPWTDEDHQKAWDFIKDTYKSSLQWINHFGLNQRWHPLCHRGWEITFDEYTKINNGMKIIIEWHWHGEPHFVQRFSHVLTIRLDKLISPEEYLKEFTKLNSINLVNGEQLIELSSDVNRLNNSFDNIQNPVETIIESLGVSE